MGRAGGPVTPAVWYFCVAEKGFDRTRALLKVALSSARQNTALRPVCLYAGGEAGHVAFLEGLGAEVVRRRPSFEDALALGYGDRLEQFVAHWLRVDIPLVERDEEVVLYTDIDVMFLRPPVVARAPRTLAAAPEVHRWRWPHFNSGVMVLNLPAMRQVHEAFVEDIRRRMRAGRGAGNDQVSYNRFFRWRHARMSARMNWKPYWGIDPEARVVHFHGPKPGHVRALLDGRGGRMMPVYERLWARAPAAYAHYVREFDRFLGA